MQQKLTKKQAEILAFIGDFIRDHGYAPSYREVAAHLGISSPATVHEHIKNLERKGFLTSDPDSARSIEIEPSFMNVAKAILLPLKGLITAGAPIEAVETAESYAVPETMVKDGGKTFVLRVKGDSMIEDGILSGDYVVVEENPAPRDGEVVVALIENEYATLKRLYREKGRVRLQPANRTMQPIYVDAITVQGVVRGVIRDFRSVA